MHTHVTLLLTQRPKQIYFEQILDFDCPKLRKKFKTALMAMSLNSAGFITALPNFCHRFSEIASQSHSSAVSTCSLRSRHSLDADYDDGDYESSDQ